MNSTFVPQLRRPGFAPSGVLVRPSGAATLPQIANAQAVLAWLNHLPRQRSSVTGVMNAQTTAAVRAFQDNYNREQAARNYRFSPRTLTVDGALGPNTLAALANYNTSAAAQGYGIGMTQQEIAQWGAVYAAGQNPNVNSIVALPGNIPASVTPGKPMGTTATIGKTDAINTTLPGAGGGTTSPVVYRPPVAAPPATPLAAPASTTPWGPILAVGGGVLVLGGALYLRSQRKKRSGGKG